MIELSPLDVRKKKEDFRRTMRGYDAEQVDAFLDLVAERLAGMLAEERSLRERVDLLEGKLERFEEREKALNDALVAAQELREEARAQAERETELRIREAEGRADEILRDAREEERSVERSLEDLKARRDRFLRSFRGTLERFLEEVASEQGQLHEKDREGAPRGPRMHLEPGRDRDEETPAYGGQEGGGTNPGIRLEGGGGDPPPGEKP